MTELNRGDYHKVITKSPYIKTKHGDHPVCRIVGTPEQVWGVKDWREMAGNMTATLYRNRMVVEESVRPDDAVVCVDIDGHSELLSVSEIGAKVDKPRSAKEEIEGYEEFVDDLVKHLENNNKPV
jgi:hypothetical protein